MQVRSHLDTSSKYGLLQLTPELEASLVKGELAFKGAGNDPLKICTNNSTHSVRRLKQSNTLLLSKHIPVSNTDEALENESSNHVQTKEVLEVFSVPYEVLETIPAKPSINWSKFPVYSGLDSLMETNNVVENEFCSDVEFEALAKAKPAVFYQGSIYVVHADVVHDLIVELVSVMVETGDLELNSDYSQIKFLVNSSHPNEMVECVYNMFKPEPTGTITSAMDKELLSRWIGNYLLKKYVKGVQSHLLIKEWSRDLPVKLNTNINQLKGSYVEAEPGWIVPININSLSPEIKPRLEQLFAIKSEWLIDDIEPYLDPVVPPGQIFEKWILKYARKHKSPNKGVLISQRK